MIVIRPAEEKDVVGVYTLAMVASDGLTTLPVSQERLLERIRFSQHCLDQDIKTPGSESYFLVLEDTEKGFIAGTTGIFAAVGLDRPFYNYEIKTERHSCNDPDVQTEVHTLQYGTPYKGACELATLYLHPEYRFGGNGTLLSKSRHLMLASYPERFSHQVMAEIRGWVDEDGQSPFWDAIGRNFFQMDLVAADRINSLGNHEFIEKLMPKHPVYIEMLPREAQNVVGVTHHESTGALKLLESEGLAYNNIIDVFDGGPCVEAQLTDIRAVKESKVAKVNIIKEGDGEGRFLIANPGLASFRAIQGTLLEKDKSVGLTSQQAEGLEVRKGDKVRYVSLKRAMDNKDKNYIGGRRVDGKGAAFTSENPATGEIIWQGNHTSPEQVGEAFDAAKAAYKPWRKLSLEERAEYLRKYASVVEENKDKLAATISQETGKALWDATGEVGSVIGKIEISIRAYEERTPTKEGTQGAARTRLTHRPHGVMGVIGPYNFPCHLANGHIVPALLAGNTVVFKPSSWTAWSGEMLVDLFHQAGIPDGVLNLVQGGRDAGQAMIQNPNLKGLLFTGGVPTGKIFSKQLAERLDVIVALELGGNNPFIVWDVEDLKSAAIVTVQSGFIGAGQRCTCARRLIIPEGAKGDAFMDEVLKVMDGLSVGMPDADPQPFMGCLISADAAQMVLDRQAELEAAGGKVLRRAEKLDLGDAFISPSLIDVTAIENVSDEETFGPLLQVYRVKDFEAAIERANATQFGLAAGLLSDNKALYEQFYNEIEAGVVNWNQVLPGASSAAPFGGIGDSGNHRPAAFYAADYCAWPVASLENSEDKLTPATPPPGMKV